MEITGTKEEVLRGVERLRSISASTTSATRCITNSTREADLSNVMPRKTDDGCIRPNAPVQLELLPLRPTSLRALPLSTVATPPVTPFLWQLLASNPCKGAAKLIDVNQIPSAADYDDADESSPSVYSSLPRDSVRGTECRVDLKREREKACDAEERERTCEVSSRGSDEEEIGQTRKKLRLTKEQSALLEDSFRIHSTLNPKQKSSLAKQLNLRPRQVEVWFQNRRARSGKRPYKYISTKFFSSASCSSRFPILLRPVNLTAIDPAICFCCVQDQA
eukprot:c27917_g3_i1 orf=537-1367(+)